MNKRWIDFNEALALASEGKKVFRANGERLSVNGSCELQLGGFDCDRSMASRWGIRFYTLTTEAVPLTLPEAIQAHLDELKVEAKGASGSWYPVGWALSVSNYIIEGYEFRLPPIEKKKRTVTIEVEEGAEIRINGKVVGRETGEFRHRWCDGQFQLRHLGEWRDCTMDDTDYQAMWRIIEEPVSFEVTLNARVEGNVYAFTLPEPIRVLGKTFVFTEKQDA